ncbi:MAG: hypothetical protein KME45_28085 [Stenomitos rutilans HA7619-LM2]|nr:hypothetical protein [Stenomitos rutilans HA7619-LM2]
MLGDNTDRAYRIGLEKNRVTRIVMEDRGMIAIAFKEIFRCGQRLVTLQRSSDGCRVKMAVGLL